MQKLSVVIVCKNEEDVIGHALKSVQGVTDDIVIFDNGSTDRTIEILKQANIQLHQGPWEGFGKTKQKATALAKYDWVLSLDADESLDEELKNALLNLQPEDEKTVYSIRRQSSLGNKYLKYGEWGKDKQIRLFNKKRMNWDDAIVHESLVLPSGTVIKKLGGYILHRTMKDINDYAQKIIQYAMLNAEKYHRQGRKTSWFKIRLSPGFTFCNYYFLKLGFLDGHAGYLTAKMTAFYTFLKYARLKELNRKAADGRQ
jgi:glycosyltransferase involved in cell wall biosynthesis